MMSQSLSDAINQVFEIIKTREIELDYHPHYFCTFYKLETSTMLQSFSDAMTKAKWKSLNEQ